MVWNGPELGCVNNVTVVAYPTLSCLENHYIKPWAPCTSWELPPWEFTSLRLALASDVMRMYPLRYVPCVFVLGLNTRGVGTLSE